MEKPESFLLYFDAFRLEFVMGAERNHRSDPNRMGVSDVPVAATSAHLLGAAPNPFNPRTTVRFNLPASVDVRLDLHDAAGRLVAVLAEGPFAAGEHGVTWDGRDRQGRAAASGTYYARLRAAGDTGTIPLTLVR